MGKKMCKKVSILASATYVYNFLCTQLQAQGANFKLIMQELLTQREDEMKGCLRPYSNEVKIFPQRLKTLQKTLKNVVLGRKGLP